MKRTEPLTIPVQNPELPFDRYIIEVMDRGQLTDAPYNPRILSEAQKQHLKAGLKKHGMLQPPIWNRTTGHIVGGHQRLHQMDSLCGSPNYKLQVAVVEMAEKDEMEANILLNNPSAMGDWDLPKLEIMLPGLELSGTGFDMGDVYRLLGDMPGTAHPEVEALAERLRGFQEAYAGVSNNVGRDDFYLVMVFKDYAARTDFLNKHGLVDNRYQDGVQLAFNIAQAAKAALIAGGSQAEPEPSNLVEK